MAKHIINPEVLASLMRYSCGKKVLEVGAASGENSLLIGLAGAEVWVNDIEHLELREFQKKLARITKKIKKKFHLIKGDCLQVFQGKEYTEKFDVIYARNIFHLFFGDRRDRFIDTMNRLL